MSRWANFTENYLFKSNTVKDGHFGFYGKRFYCCLKFQNVLQSATILEKSKLKSLLKSWIWIFSSSHLMLLLKMFIHSTFFMNLLNVSHLSLSSMNKILFVGSRFHQLFELQGILYTQNLLGFYKSHSLVKISDFSITFDNTTRKRFTDLMKFIMVFFFSVWTNIDQGHL